MRPLPRVLASPNGHSLINEHGEPFFWLGDTAWELFHRLLREEAQQYFQNRQQKRFTVIQAVALAEFDGLNTPNAYGQRPLVDNDPTRPNEPYWDYVDELIRMAEQHDLYIGLLPTWGDKVTDHWGVGPIVFNVENAYTYGLWLGKRYAQQTNLIWILGGDRAPIYHSRTTQAEVDDRPLWRAMAKGIREGVGQPLLMTYHPWGGHSTSEYIHAEAWLDMNMMQSGHGGGHDVPVWEMIARDYHLQPAKPTLDGEPNYEDHPVNPWPTWDPALGYYDDYDVRKQLYRSVFAGGCGVTYGHHSVWQMYSPRQEAVNHAKMYWNEAIDRPGAAQVGYLRSLMESRPFLTRIPDQTLLVNPPTERSQFMCATRDLQGSYALVYLPVSHAVTVNLSRLSAGQVNVWWIDPRSGKVVLEGKASGGAVQTFTPPEGRLDWVLCLDDVAAGYPPPGG